MQDRRQNVSVYECVCSLMCVCVCVIHRGFTWKCYGYPTVLEWGMCSCLPRLFTYGCTCVFTLFHFARVTILLSPVAICLLICATYRFSKASVAHHCTPYPTCLFLYFISSFDLTFVIFVNFCRPVRTVKARFSLD